MPCMGALWIVPLTHGSPLLSNGCSWKFRIARTFLKLVLGQWFATFTIAPVAFFSDTFALPLPLGLVDRSFFCESMDGQPFSIWHSPSLKYNAGDAHNPHSQSWLQFPLLLLKHSKRCSRWTSPCLCGVLSFCESVSLYQATWSSSFAFPCLCRFMFGRTFSAFRARAFRHPRSPITVFFSSSFRRVCCCCSVSWSFFEKTTCSAVAARGCHWPWSSIFGRFWAPFSEQCLADMMSSHASWV